MSNITSCLAGSWQYGRNQDVVRLAADVSKYCARAAVSSEALSADSARVGMGPGEVQDPHGCVRANGEYPEDPGRQAAQYSHGYLERRASRY